MLNFTIAELGRIIRVCAGEAQSVVWDESILDTTFTDLEYDSIAMLEAASRIELELGIVIEDGVIPELRTPRLFVAKVNELLAARALVQGGQTRG